VIGMEALVRWHSKTLGDVNTAHFINALEHSEIQLIAKFHEWVLRTTFKQILIWQRMDISVPVHINFSAVYLQQQECLTLVQALMQEYNIHPSWFGIEVTESSPITDMGRMKYTLDNFHAMGINIALDDFCTSYSSLEHLSDFPVTKIKIDKKFIHGLTGESSGQKAIAIILEAIVEMAIKLGIEIVAEGVETIKQLELVTYMGFDSYQGYFLCPPIPVDLVTDMLKAEHQRQASIPVPNYFPYSYAIAA